jgi:4-hydroxy-tetrahydrodipicolinate synthase
MFSGSIVAIITPMKIDGSIDYQALDKLVDYQIANGTKGIVATGTTGEPATMTPEEHISVIDRIVKHVDGRCQVIAGTGSNSTSETVFYTKEAEALGVDACLLCVPYYNKPTQEGMYQHFKTVSKQTSLPIVLYNVPGRTVADMSADTAARLAELESVVAIKEANTIERIRTLIDKVGHKIAVLTGDDPVLVDTIAYGGQGVISVTANVAPKLVANICQLALSGDIETARALESAAMPLHESLFIESNPIPVKWAAAEMGLCENGIRLPLTPLSQQYHEQVRAQLQVHKLL